MQIERFLAQLKQWAEQQPDITATMLVGSYARGTARTDSDVDLVILTVSPERYLGSTSFADHFGSVSRWEKEDWGMVTSLRVWYQDGLEVEYGFALPDWASQPLDVETRQVLSDGVQIVFDRGGSLLFMQSIPDDFRAILAETEAAEYRLYEGESEPYLRLWSQAQDVTVMGAMGAYYRGPDQVKQNTEFVASRFRGGRNQRTEQVALGSSGDLGFSVWIERAEAHVAGRDDYAPLALRVTHVFRRENGEWKIIHRHGDAVMEQAQTPPVRQS